MHQDAPTNSGDPAPDGRQRPAGTFEPSGPGGAAHATTPPGATAARSFETTGHLAPHVRATGQQLMEVTDLQQARQPAIGKRRRPRADRRPRQQPPLTDGTHAARKQLFADLSRRSLSEAG